jgi:hypothetical protein
MDYRFDISEVLLFNDNVHAKQRGATVSDSLVVSQTITGRNNHEFVHNVLALEQGIEYGWLVKDWSFSDHLDLQQSVRRTLTQRVDQSLTVSQHINEPKTASVTDVIVIDQEIDYGWSVRVQHIAQGLTLVQRFSYALIRNGRMVGYDHAIM